LLASTPEMKVNHKIGEDGIQKRFQLPLTDSNASLLVPLSVGFYARSVHLLIDRLNGHDKHGEKDTTPDKQGFRGRFSNCKGPSFGIIKT
jgi:hypothetical protein